MARFKDRRRFPRQAAAFPLSFREVLVNAPGQRRALVQDVSPGGVRFRTQEFISLRSRLLFELHLPGTPPLKSFGRAVWIREMPGDGGFEVGGAFVDQTPNHQSAIESRLTSLAVPGQTL